MILPGEHQTVSKVTTELRAGVVAAAVKGVRSPSCW